MKLEPSTQLASPLNGFSRSATEQALENLTQALRVLELAPRDNCDLCPHPLTIVRAEIENARRYLSIQNSDTRTGSPARERTSVKRSPSPLLEMSLR
jgi:hypothetical protein